MCEQLVSYWLEQGLPLSFAPAVQTWYSERVGSSVTFHSHLSPWLAVNSERKKERKKNGQLSLNGEFLKYQNMPSLFHLFVPPRTGVTITFQQN